MAEQRVLERIETLRRTLEYSLGTPRRWKGLLRRMTFARAIQGSNRIEGYNVTVEDAIAAAEGEPPVEASQEAWAAVSGYRQAMTYVLQLADDPYFTYSADLIRSLHFMMVQHDLSRHPGKWRPGPIYVRNGQERTVVYEGPPAETVPALMASLVEALQGDQLGTHPLVAAAMAHLNLVMIHPFSDGNGRMARCLQTLVLARTGVVDPMFSSIEEYLGRNTREYYDVLAEVGRGAWNPRNDPSPWIRFCLKAHFTQASTLLKRSREMQKLWDALEGEVMARGLPERTLLALSDAAMGLRVRNSTYRSVAEVSDQVASRDLKLLVDRRLLLAVGERRGRSYVASPPLKAIRVATAEPRVTEDPFVEADTPTRL